jgi:hypothetical protein
LPGAAVGADGATAVGLNLLPPLGLRPFSVGDAGALLDIGDVVVGVVVGGAWFSLGLHDETSKVMTISAAPPMTAPMRAAAEGEFMRFLFRSGELALAGGLR